MRRRAHDVLPWRPGRTSAPLDRLLLGLQNGIPAADFASAIGNPRWPSTRVADGPHAALLRMTEQDVALTDEQILHSDYADMARHCIRLRGFYFSAVDDAGIVQAARDYIARHRGEVSVLARPHASRPGEPPRVARIAGSDCYQVLDGHHRVASAAVAAQESIPVRVKWVPVRTPLQQLLGQGTRRSGKRQLCQPVDAPELELSWTGPRGRANRIDTMLALLRDRGLMPPATSSYLDVGSCYGWFPAQLQQAGFQVRGVAQDQRAPALAAAAYGLDPSLTTVSSAESFLLQAREQWDVVSCFGCLQHAGPGGTPAISAELLALLDASARRVLFLLGEQRSEPPTTRSGSSSTSGFVGVETTFDEIVDLGPDGDVTAAAGGEQRRHLFACIRS